MATLWFTTFNQRTTPEPNGIEQVSPDVAVDQERPQQPYYLIRIKVSDVRLHATTTS